MACQGVAGQGRLVMIRQDFTQQYENDCSTCAHRVERHPSKRENPTRPRVMHFVCLVEGKAITEHGTRMNKTTWIDGRLDEKWVYECPCKIFDKEKGMWVPCDYEPRRES